MAVHAGLRWFTSTLVNRPGAAGRISWRTPFPFSEQAPARKPRSFTGDFPHRYLQLGQSRRPPSVCGVWLAGSHHIPSQLITSHHIRSSLYFLLSRSAVLPASCTPLCCQDPVSDIPGDSLELFWGGYLLSAHTHTRSTHHRECKL